MADTTTNQMPMGVAAKLPLTASDLMPAISAPAPITAAPPQQAAGMMAGPGGTAIGFPSPDAPLDHPYDVTMQPDGSAIWQSKTDPPVVIGVVPAPKLPVSMQPKA